MTKNLQSSHQVLDRVLGYYLWGVLGPIINTSVFSEFSSKKLLVIQFFISTMHSISFSIWCVSPGREEIELSIISITVKANPVFPNDISQG